MLYFLILCTIVTLPLAAILGHKDMYSFLAENFKMLNTDDPAFQMVKADQSAQYTTGFVTYSYYASTSTCSGDAYNEYWIALGTCVIFHTNSSDPAAPDPACGSFISMSAYNTSDNKTFIEYTFYKDSACTIPGNDSCNRGYYYETNCEVYQYYDSYPESSSLKIASTLAPPPLNSLVEM